MFLFNRIGDLRCPTKKVEIFAHTPLIGTSTFYATSKGIIIEVIVGFF
jgi:hypothetical protein